jgi:hypothetical protein
VVTQGKYILKDKKRAFTPGSLTAFQKLVRGRGE